MNVKMEKSVKKHKELTKEEMEEIRKKISEPLFVKIIKIAVILFGIVILTLLIYTNFFQTHNYQYFYDIGSEKDSYLSPNERISDKIADVDNNYRNLTSSLVYFNIPINPASDFSNITIRFKDNFPENGKLYIGPKDKKEWHYKQYLIYSKTIESLVKEYPYEYKDGLLLINMNDSNDYSIDQIMSNKKNIRLVTDQNISIGSFKIEDYQPDNLEIDTALREKTEFYVYVKGYLRVNVEKKDLNWYDNKDTGSDELKMILYDLNGNMIANTTVRDDGITDEEPDKNNKNENKGELLTGTLEEGVYRLVLSNNGDMLVTKINLNQNKVVVNKRIFLAQSNAYFNNFEKKTKVFFKAVNPSRLTINTYHNNGINQTITATDYFTSHKIEISNVTTDYFIDLKNSDNLYEIKPEKNDIIISGPVLFSFTEDSWFDPFSYGKFAYKNDINYIKNNADYVLVKYTPVVDEGEWKLVSLSMNLNETYATNEKLSMLITTDHLSLNKNETTKVYIPVDWINITVHRPGLIDKWRKNG